MQYRFPLFVFTFLSLILSSTTYADFGRITRKPGFFGFTRSCLHDWEHEDEAIGGCVTLFLPLVMGDSITAPTQTMINIIDYIEKPSKEPSSTQQTTDRSSKTSSESDSSKKAEQGKEIPEERKVMQKLSLFMLVADDARGYLATGTSTPLLQSAAQALRTTQIGTDDDITVESQKILEVEVQLFQAMK
jgi:hypothetical protein